MIPDRGAAERTLRPEHGSLLQVLTAHSSEKDAIQVLMMELTALGLALPEYCFTITERAELLNEANGLATLAIEDNARSPTSDAAIALSLLISNMTILSRSVVICLTAWLLRCEQSIGTPRF